MSEPPAVAGGCDRLAGEAASVPPAVAGGHDAPDASIAPTRRVTMIVPKANTREEEPCEGHSYSCS